MKKYVIVDLKGNYSILYAERVFEVQEIEVPVREKTSNILDTAGCSFRLTNALKNGDITTVDELTELVQSGDLMKFKNIGRLTFKEAEQLLARHDVKL